MTHTVHKSVACHYSRFFETAFNSFFVEGNTPIMRLNNVNEKIFGKVVHWMYEKEIENGTELDLLSLAKLWTIAGRFLIPALQNMAISTIYKKLEISVEDSLFQEFVEYA